MVIALFGLEEVNELGGCWYTMFSRGELSTDAFIISFNHRAVTLRAVFRGVSRRRVWIGRILPMCFLKHDLSGEKVGFCLRSICVCSQLTEVRFVFEDLQNEVLYI